VDGAPFADNSSGSPFPLDEGGADIGTIPTLGVIPVTYDVTIQNTGEFRNEVEFVSPSDAAPAGLEGMLPLKAVGYEVAMTLVDPSSGQANAGEVITFEMSITNTGSVTITQLPVRHEFDANYLTFESASQTFW
jgi:uncharacterized repeat protein (TIGR01451 family)